MVFTALEGNPISLTHWGRDGFIKEPDNFLCTSMQNFVCKCPDGNRSYGAGDPAESSLGVLVWIW